MRKHAFLFALFVPLCAPLVLGIFANDVVRASGDTYAGDYVTLPADHPLLTEAAYSREPSTLNDVVLAKMSHLPKLDPALSEEREERCLAQAVYFEARSEPLEGQLAVAQVVLNRVASRRYPDSICQVVFQNDHRPFRCQFSFACDGMSDNPYNRSAWKLSRAVAKVALEGAWQDIADRATHYHAVYVAPYWRDHMEQTAQHGLHIFYRDES